MATHRLARIGGSTARFVVMPWVCVFVGVGMAIKGLIAPENDGATFVVLGVGFVILGVVAAVVARWMAKRGI